MKQKAVKFISRGLFNPLPSSVYSVGLMKQLYLDVTIISVTKLNMFVWTGVCWLALSRLNSVSGPETEEVDSAVYLSGALSWGPTKQVCWLFHFSSGGFSVVWIRMINGEAPPSDSNFTLTHTHTLWGWRGWQNDEAVLWKATITQVDWLTGPLMFSPATTSSRLLFGSACRLLVAPAALISVSFPHWRYILFLEK